MRCIYINLDRSTARREQLEKNFLHVAKPNWRLERFSAVDGEKLTFDKQKKNISCSEYACILSHFQVIKSLQFCNEVVLIAEDDIHFGKNSCDLINSLANNYKNEDWDIMFTDLTITNFNLMLNILKLRDQVFLGKEKIVCSSLNSQLFGNFASSTAYLISPRGVTKLLKLLENHQNINLPYDIYLRQLIAKNKINANVVVPFITSISPLSWNSDIQKDENLATRDKLLWLLFRCYVFIDFDQNFCNEQLAWLKKLYANDFSESLANSLAISFAGAFDK